MKTYEKPTATIVAKKPDNCVSWTFSRDLMMGFVTGLRD
jgi:hypothetical protein